MADKPSDRASSPDTQHAAERERRIIDVVMALADGEVSTYGDIAATAGYPRQARLVGRLLQTTEVEVPWWRVVNASGRLVPGAEHEQSALLRAEGVTVTNDHVRSAPIGRFRRPNSPRAAQAPSPPSA